MPPSLEVLACCPLLPRLALFPSVSPVLLVHYSVVVPGRHPALICGNPRQVGRGNGWGQGKGKWSLVFLENCNQPTRPMYFPGIREALRPMQSGHGHVVKPRGVPREPQRPAAWQTRCHALGPWCNGHVLVLRSWCAHARLGGEQPALAPLNVRVSESSCLCEGVRV